MRAVWLWVLLVTLTLLTWGAGFSGFAGQWLALGLLGSVLLKGHVVIADFMGMRHAPLMWRMLLHGWLLLVAALIFMAYRMGMNP